MSSNITYLYQWASETRNWFNRFCILATESLTEDGTNHTAVHACSSRSTIRQSPEKRWRKAIEIRFQALTRLSYAMYWSYVNRSKEYAITRSVFPELRHVSSLCSIRSGPMKNCNTGSNCPARPGGFVAMGDPSRCVDERGKMTTDATAPSALVAAGSGVRYLACSRVVCGCSCRIQGYCHQKRYR